MADFPILKWMQVDGRSVPFTYPQHQKGNGYVETGEDNPLPTGNHVMTESGIWIPQRGTDEGAAHTQLTNGSNVELISLRDENFAQGVTTQISDGLIDVSDYKEIIVSWSTDTGFGRDVIVEIQWSSGTDVTLRSRIDETVIDTNEDVGDKGDGIYQRYAFTRVKRPYMSLYLTVTGDDGIRNYISVLGVRS